MERNTALATAVAVTATVFAATTAAVVNLELIDSGSSEPVGKLDASNVAELVGNSTTTSVADPTTGAVIEIVIEDEGGVGVDGPAPSVEPGAFEIDESDYADADHDDEYDEPDDEDELDDEDDEDDEDHDDD